MPIKSPAITAFFAFAIKKHLLLLRIQQIKQKFKKGVIDWTFLTYMQN
nr:MAG TPA: hypothetical protein [Caudoviricetes sp.]DAL02118.1 MAG TPA: hypothetical protein [Caudoviricetes sp.]